MFQWLRRIWHFHDEVCVSYDVAISKEEWERRMTDLFKLSGSAGCALPARAECGGHTDLQKAGRSKPRQCVSTASVFRSPLRARQ